MSQANPHTQTDILLNAGTNELEVLVFDLGSAWYGINVAKVREVVMPPETSRSPGCPEDIAGMFNIRGQLVPLVELSRHLGLPGRDGDTSEETSGGRVIICEFNGRQVGFLVDGVEQIRRMSWTAVRPAPEVGSGDIGMITGVIELGDQLVMMLDFESIADDVSAESKLHVSSVPNDLGVDRGAQKLVVAEDSKFMRDRLGAVLEASGYTDVRIFGDGLAAWKAIEASAEPLSAIVSDIEMPAMDGLHLCKRTKAHPVQKDTPVLLFSSLISSDNLKKGAEVGADYQVAKPQLADLVRMIDRLVLGMSVENPAEAAQPSSAS